MSEIQTPEELEVMFLCFSRDLPNLDAVQRVRQFEAIDAILDTFINLGFLAVSATPQENPQPL